MHPKLHCPGEGCASLRDWRGSRPTLFTYDGVASRAAWTYWLTGQWWLRGQLCARRRRRAPRADHAGGVGGAARAWQSRSSVHIRKGQRHLSGLWWSATTGGHVGFESWLERDLLRTFSRRSWKVVRLLSSPSVADMPILAIFCQVLSAVPAADRCSVRAAAAVAL